MLHECRVMFDDETGKVSYIDIETGEELKSEAKKTTTSKPKKKKDESSDPQLILEENKYSLNTAAVELLGVQPEDKLSVKYKKVGKQSIPVLGTDEAFGVKGGNKVTKSFTVACRGKANEELSTYGNIFTLSENPDGSGTFILNGNKVQTTPEVEDEAIDIEDEDVTADLQKIGTAVDEATDAEEINADELDSFLNDLD